MPPTSASLVMRRTFPMGSAGTDGSSTVSRIAFIEHQGHRILQVDFSGLRRHEDALPVFEEVRALVETQPLGSVLSLTDVSGSAFDPQIIEALKDLAVHNRPYVRAAAVTGAAGVLQVALAIVNQFSDRKIASFTDVERAKEWLVQQAARPA